MTWLDFVLLAAVLVAFVIALRYTVRSMRKGKCPGCSDCSKCSNCNNKE